MAVGAGGADHKYQGTVKVLYHLHPEHPTPEYRNLNPGLWSSVCVCVCVCTCVSMCVRVCVCVYMCLRKWILYTCIPFQKCSELFFSHFQVWGYLFLTFERWLSVSPTVFFGMYKPISENHRVMIICSPCVLWPNSWNLSYPNPLPVCSSRYFIPLTFLFFPLPLQLSKMMGYTLKECECKEIQYIAYYSF